MPTIDNPNINKWYDTENARNEKRDEQTALFTFLLILQMLIYGFAWLDELDDLQDAIDDLMCLKNMLHRADIDLDYPWMRHKQEVLYLPIPVPEMCADASRYDSETSCEGKGVDVRGDNYAKETCTGIPKGWDIKEGSAFQALSQSYTGSILSNAAKRRQEKFQKNKTRLVLSAQQASRMNIRPAIEDLNLAVSVHSKLSDIYAQGFNSAGLGLGSILGQGTV